MPELTLKEYLRAVHEHADTSLKRLPVQVELLERLTACTARAREALEHSAEDKLLLPLFFLQAYSAFFSTAHLMLSGEVVSGYAVLRSNIEYGAYAAAVSAKPTLGRLWLNRHESDVSRRDMRRAFSGPKLQEALSVLDPTLRREFDFLYERAIDYGAHPNERALSTRVALQRDEGAIRAAVAFVSMRDSEHQAGLKTAFHAHLHVLDVFAHIFPLRFELTGVTATISELRAYV